MYFALSSERKKYFLGQDFIFLSMLFTFLNRVTRLGEFSPIGRLFTLGCVRKITEVAQIYGLHFFHGTIYVLILTKKWLG
jgi:hypothetical protein